MTGYKDDIAAFLQSYNWDYFFTVTPRNGRRDPLAFNRDVWGELRPFDHLPVDHSGDATRAFITCEPFFLKGLHVHGLIAGTSELRLPWWIEEGLNRRFGRSRVELCRSQEQVAGYCGKYVSKNMGGDNYDFFGDWQS